MKEIFFRPIIVSIDVMDMFKQKETMKKRLFRKSTWSNWLINYISEPIKNSGWCWRQNYKSLKQLQPNIRVNQHVWWWKETKEIKNAKTILRQQN